MHHTGAGIWVNAGLHYFAPWWYPYPFLNAAHRKTMTPGTR